MCCKSFETVSFVYSLVKSINKCYYFKITSRLQSHAPNKNIPPDKNDFGDFPSKDASCFWSSHTLSCHASSDTICSKDTNIEFYNSFPTFWGKKWNLLFTVTIHLSLFTCYYSLRNFAYLRGVVPYISSKFLVCLVQDFFLRESFHLWAFLWEISLLTTTSYLLYKACNS